MKPIYSKEFDEGYDSYKRGTGLNPYLALNDSFRATEWARGYRTAQWEASEPHD